MAENAPKHSDPGTGPVLPADGPTLIISVAGEPETRRRITEPVSLIGGRQDCLLRIGHTEVSKLHAAIVCTGRETILCDLRSRAGTFLNENRVVVAAFGASDVVRVGPIGVEVSWGESPAGAVHVEQPGAKASDPLGAPLALSYGSETVRITSPAALIGRREQCHVTLDTPDVSLVHALVFELDGRPAIFDLGSRSGTFVNGRRVVLSRLRNGDRLSIGGIDLDVACEPCPGDDRPSLAVANDSGGAERVAGVSDELDLEVLDGSISILLDGVQASSDRLAERSAQLDQREAELAAREAELELRAAEGPKANSERRRKGRSQHRPEAYTDSERELQARRIELDALAEGLAEERARLESERSSLEGRAREVEASARRQDAQQSALTVARRAVEQDKSVLKQMRAEAEAETARIEHDRALIQSELQKVKKRRMECERKLSSMRERETDLEWRKKQVAEARERLERRENATPIFSPSSEGDADATQAGVLRETDGVTSAAPDNDLPAPMVDRPMFEVAEGRAPAEWPDNLRERFHVLRRLSKKPDTELAAQVWAEAGFEAGQPASATRSKLGKRAKRRWWA